MRIETGQLFILKNYSRFCIVGKTFTLHKRSYIQVYPLSASIFMATDEDFIISDEKILNGHPMMIEIWNPLVLNRTWLGEFKGVLETDFLDLYKSFILLREANLKLTELKAFTGPPITNNNDVRLRFKQDEINIFIKIKQLITNSVSNLGN